MLDDVRDLVARCLRGDASATRALVDQFHGQVFGLCYRMLGHRQDAEDVTQESLLRALRHLAQWDPNRDIRPWLLTIAGNRCRSFLATRRHKPTAMSETDHIADHRPETDSARHLAEEVDQALGYLREEYRRAFLLFHTEQMSYADIAAALACPVGTVKTWVHRARRELAERLRERGVIEELPDAMRRI